MLPIHCLFEDLYNERWGDPCDPAPANSPRQAGRRRDAVRLLMVVPFAGLCLRQRRQRPDAWSLTLPIDRRLR